MSFSLRIHIEFYLPLNQCSGAAPFWAALAPEVRGPGADSDQIGSAPAPSKKRRLQAAPAPNTKICHFDS